MLSASERCTARSGSGCPHAAVASNTSRRMTLGIGKRIPVHLVIFCNQESEGEVGWAEAALK